jgi:hypothetical protein
VKIELACSLTQGFEASHRPSGQRHSNANGLQNTSDMDAVGL